MISFTDLLKQTSSPNLLEENAYTQEDVIQQFEDVHGGAYDYSKVKYSHNREPVVIICKKHDKEFLMKPVHHKAGCGCPECAKEATRNSTVSNKADFIKKARSLHGKKAYEYDNVVYISSRTPVAIVCNDCGNTFEQTPNKHLAGCGCPVCAESMGEQEIRKWLLDHKLDFQAQKTFDDCRMDRPLPFDFFIPSRFIAIEFDGKQHFLPLGFFSEDEAEENLQRIQTSDKIKTDYCKAKNIRLIRIRYTDDIKSILDKEIPNAK